ncbi:MAG: hypothetical protein IPJ19_12260 [Planctomycetes bacterium]|nr:hypothetical protein [Planctomycetota bacterium]
MRLESRCQTLLAIPLLVLAGCAGTRAESAPGTDAEGWLVEFEVDPSDWSATGRNDYFVLEPGYQLVLENERKTGTLVITVLEETRLVDNVETRVVEERETAFGKLKEVSRNYFAMSKSTRDIYYFGEEVDMYKDGVVSSHEGSWESGRDLALFGLAIPGKLAVGDKWYQEEAPDVALDRSEVLALDARFDCPAGKFSNCLEVQETTPLEYDTQEKKLYAPGVGLVKDGSLRLVSYGKAAAGR